MKWDPNGTLTGSNLELKYSKVAEILFQPVWAPELPNQELTWNPNGAKLRPDWSQIGGQRDQN